MGRIRRFGILIDNVSIDYPIVDKMNWDYYYNKLSEYKKKKIVYVVPVKFWGERPLCSWFIRKHEELGFKEIIEERTTQYERIKKKMGFHGYPDFLVQKESKWERLEVEVFSASYKLHPSDYSEYLLYYDETISIKYVMILTVKDYVGCQEIINIQEIPAFLYLYDSEFKNDYDQRMMDHIRSKMLE